MLKLEGIFLSCSSLSIVVTSPDGDFRLSVTLAFDCFFLKTEFCIICQYLSKKTGEGSVGTVGTLLSQTAQQVIPFFPYSLIPFRCIHLKNLHCPKPLARARGCWCGWSSEAPSLPASALPKMVLNFLPGRSRWVGALTGLHLREQIPDALQAAVRTNGLSGTSLRRRGMNTENGFGASGTCGTRVHTCVKAQRVNESERICKIIGNTSFPPIS